MLLSFLVTLLILILVLGLIYWITTLFPLTPPLRTAANIVLALIALVLLLGLVGWLPGVGRIPLVRLQ